MPAPLEVLHLVGSPTDAYLADLSRLYARDCLANTADPQRYTARIAHVAPGGTWSFPDDLSAAALAATPPGETLYVLPTYTAMLEIRKTLSDMGYTHPFWEDE